MTIMVAMETTVVIVLLVVVSIFTTATAIQSGRSGRLQAKLPAQVCGMGTEGGYNA